MDVLGFVMHFLAIMIDPRMSGPLRHGGTEPPTGENYGGPKARKGEQNDGNLGSALSSPGPSRPEGVQGVSME